MIMKARYWTIIIADIDRYLGVLMLMLWMISSDPV